MESMEELLNEVFESGFGPNCDISIRVVCTIECALSLVVVGLGGVLLTICVEGMFMDLSRK